MTVEKLQQANALQAEINKAKECLRIIESSDSAISCVDGSESVAIGEGAFREQLRERMNYIIESLERDFSWL